MGNLLLAYSGGGGIDANMRFLTGCLLMGLVLLYSNGAYAAAYGADYCDISEYLIGDVYVKAFFVEYTNTDSTEVWTLDERTNCLTILTNACNWIESQYPFTNTGALLNFTVDWESVEISTVEPISTNAGPYGQPGGGTEERIWVQEIMDGKGYNQYTNGYPYHNVADYCNDLRNSNNMDWCIIVFFVDNSADANGNFLNNKPPAFASGTGGPYCILGSDMENAGYTASNVPYIYAHEMIHNFFAMDEYEQPMYNDKARQGYLDGQNSNYTNLLGEVCIYNAGTSICSATREQIGWVDSNSNGIPSILDIEPDTILNPYTPDPTTNNTPTYTGSVTSPPLPNVNSYDTNYTPLHLAGPSPLEPWTRNDITINTITNVQYRIRQGVVIILDWTNAVPVDGSFNENTEDFSFVSSPLSDGTYIFEARVWNSVGLYDTVVASDDLTITNDLDGDGMKMGTWWWVK